MSDARRKRHTGSAKSRSENGTGPGSHRSQAGSQTLGYRGRNSNANAANVSIRWFKIFFFCFLWKQNLT